MDVESEGFVMCAKNDFVSWLDEELSRRGWDDRRLSERSGVAIEALARIRAGERLEGEVCVGIARAFNTAPEVALRMGGLKPSMADDAMDLESWRRVLEQLPVEERDELLQIAMIKLDILRDGIGAPA
jgi:transcriptional regulator with XRE-family HTH domain